MTTNQNAVNNEPTPERPQDYPPPSPEQIEDIRRRLAEVPPGTIEHLHHVLRHASIDAAGSLLWNAGIGLSSAELYEYRKTLFPPGSMLDPYTSGPPVLVGRGAGRAEASERRPVPAEPTDATPVSRSAGPGSVAPQQTADPESSGSSIDQLHEVRQSLVQLLSRRAEGDIRLPISGPALLSDLRDLIARYVILPELAAETLALWVVHTYAFTLRQVTTYIGVVSPEKRCGKTTLLELLGSLAHEAVAAANISPAALFRAIEETRPTLIIDEADTFLQARDEMAGILNAGYRKSNSYVVRVAEGKSRNQSAGGASYTSPQSGLARFSCWCPKVMAAIGRLPDTLADRCIVITMQRKMPGEKCERMRELNTTEYHQRCADFVRERSNAIANAHPEIPTTLNDRAADIWEPLFAIADLAGGEWPELARQAAEKLSSNHDEISLIGYFLLDLRNWMLLKQTDRMLSRDIIAAFNPCHTRPWQDLRRGREINEYWLAAKMRELGIRPKHLRFGHSTGRGYVIEDIESALRRYVPKPDAQPPQQGP